jgi:hypothetical protein
MPSSAAMTLLAFPARTRSSCLPRQLIVCVYLVVRVPLSFDFCQLRGVLLKRSIQLPRVVFHFVLHFFACTHSPVTACHRVTAYGRLISRLRRDHLRDDVVQCVAYGLLLPSVNRRSGCSFSRSRRRRSCSALTSASYA